MSEHAVIVHHRFDDMGKVDDFHSLGVELIAAIENADAGEFDGDEFGEGECVFYMYGPDADVLFDAVSPTLRSSPLAGGGYTIKRYGDASDPSAEQSRVELTQD